MGAPLRPVFPEGRPQDFGEPLFPRAGAAHHRDGISRGGNCCRRELVRSVAEHDGCAGAEVRRYDALRMQRTHHIRPDAPRRVTPQDPRHRRQFRVLRLAGKVLEGLLEDLVRAAARIEPEDRSGLAPVAVVQHVVRRAQQGTIPFFRESLPVQIVRGSGAFLGGGDARPVLVNDDATQGLDAVGNPKRVGDGDSQLTLNPRPGVIKR